MQLVLCITLNNLLQTENSIPVSLFTTDSPLCYCTVEQKLFVSCVSFFGYIFFLGTIFIFRECIERSRNLLFTAGIYVGQCFFLFLCCSDFFLRLETFSGGCEKLFLWPHYGDQSEKGINKFINVDWSG